MPVCYVDVVTSAYPAQSMSSECYYGRHDGAFVLALIPILCDRGDSRGSLTSVSSFRGRSVSSTLPAHPSLFSYTDPYCSAGIPWVGDSVEVSEVLSVALPVVHQHMYLCMLSLYLYFFYVLYLYCPCVGLSVVFIYFQ